MLCAHSSDVARLFPRAVGWFINCATYSFLWTEGSLLALRVEIDEIDAKIIRALQRDARTSFANIAAACGVSTDTISKRFKRMKRNGVIIRTTLLLNPKSVGYEHMASIGIRGVLSCARGH